MQKMLTYTVGTQTNLLKRLLLALVAVSQLMHLCVCQSCIVRSTLALCVCLVALVQALLLLQTDFMLYCCTCAAADREHTAW
jgi:hypothetical protein